VKHHNHLTPNYVSPLCNDCNLKVKKQIFITILFHNFKKYDAHLIVKKLGEMSGRMPKIIPQTEENYISISKWFTIGERSVEVRFLDLLRFLSASLEKLVSTMNQDKLRYTRQYFSDDPQKF